MTSQNNSTLQGLLRPLFGEQGSFYISDILKNALAYSVLEISGLIDLILKDSENPIMNNLKIGMSFTTSLEMVRLVNGNNTVLSMDRAQLIRFIDTAGYNSISMFLIGQMNFDAILYDILENVNLPLTADQLRSLTAAVIMTSISVLRNIVQRTPSLRSLIPITNPILSATSSIQVGGGSSLN